MDDLLFCTWRQNRNICVDWAVTIVVSYFGVKTIGRFQSTCQAYRKCKHVKLNTLHIQFVKKKYGLDGVQLNHVLLWNAAQSGHVEIVEMLLRQPQINVNQYCDESTPMHKDSALQDAFNGATALHMATLDSHLDVIKLLLLNGADVNITDVRQQTPLIWTINSLSTTTEKCECVRLLLQQQNIDIYIQDTFGCNAMYWAKHNQFTKVVQLLEKFTKNQ
mgnify:CR=1 FL=1|tara:strand:- start:283 stop:939 length:657 start_codon:yes stop_codon:yes gene_type:complete